MRFAQIALALAKARDKGRNRGRAKRVPLRGSDEPQL